MKPQVAQTLSTSDIRRAFIDFFEQRHRHRFVPSSPVVPHQDPTLLFTNAGMNQFKDVFLGRGRRDFTRAVNTQKCIRAGGKHNDLEDVGKDTYHHTFFEMLGNWSFGDYFKAEAIEWAWKLLTEEWGLDPDRLHVTVFAGDQSDGTQPDLEAETIWRGFVREERISRWGRKENFWEMGETGPCGPCSEIHYDGTPDGSGGALVNGNDPRVIEIWNLVFIEFNRDERGALHVLPAKHVDTGMGLERIARVLQGKGSNYDIDIFTPIFDAIASHTGAHPYQGAPDAPVDIAYRVIADHVRCLTVAISDGAAPGNEGRGYVLRRILRRAVRHAHQTLGVEGPLLCDLVPAVIGTLSDAFPELQSKPHRIESIIRDEEESFLRTLDRGIRLFEQAIDQSSSAGASTISAEDAFKLHDTYGFPIDLTRVMAEERGMTVDEAGYATLMDEARQRSRQTSETSTAFTLPPDAIARLKYMNIKPTIDADKYHGRPVSATLKAIWNGTDFDNVAHVGREVALILERTNFYAEAGGQVGDEGEVTSDVFDIGEPPARGLSGRSPEGESRLHVRDTQQTGEYVLHIGRVVDGKFKIGDEVQAMVDLDRRRPILSNHTATHLLNHALREVLGDDTDQRGSLVAPDRLRFDFSCTHAIAAEHIARIESLVNDAIGRSMQVYADVVPLDEAMRIRGLRAVFGERYPEAVRVVSIGRPVDELLKNPENPEWRRYSIELCGGTHLASTDQAGDFVIVREEALAAGVRRITSLTGAAASAAKLAAEGLRSQIEDAKTARSEDLPEAVREITSQLEQLSISAVERSQMAEEIEALRKRTKAAQKEAQHDARVDVVEQARTIAATCHQPIIAEIVTGADKETLLAAMDVLRAKRPDAAAMLLSADEAAGKVVIAATVPKPLIERGLKAGDWVREAAKACGGGGGGRPDMAQAGGKDPSRVPEALHIARAFAEDALG